jgi:hypothetical protein
LHLVQSLTQVLPHQVVSKLEGSEFNTAKMTGQNDREARSPTLVPQDSVRDQQALGRVPSLGRSSSPSFLKDTQAALANAILDRQTAIVHALSHKHKEKKALNRHCHEMSNQVHHVTKVPGYFDEEEPVSGCEEIKIETVIELDFTPCRSRTPPPMLSFR